MPTNAAAADAGRGPQVRPGALRSVRRTGANLADDRSGGPIAQPGYACQPQTTRPFGHPAKRRTECLATIVGERLLPETIIRRI